MPAETSNLAIAGFNEGPIRTEIFGIHTGPQFVQLELFKRVTRNKNDGLGTVTPAPHGASADDQTEICRAMRLTNTPDFDIADVLTTRNEKNTEQLITRTRVH